MRSALAFCMLALLSLPAATAELPDAIAAPGEVLIATVHAQGTQVCECKADAAGKFTWHFREPIATLLVDGQTVGRHYAGPIWEMDDGSLRAPTSRDRAPGASTRDIPLLKLSTDLRPRNGQFAGVTTIQRLNMRGGVADANCEQRGTFLSVPYTADYAFYRKRG